MCGIAGIVWTDAQRPADRRGVEAMNAAMWHRGPDDGGSWTHGPVALGHRRLAILDLSPAGRQPMATADGRYVVVLNGEIYNYRELRGELASHGARFRSKTDTEVVLEAYRRWGRSCVERFNGMWAFALYDVPARELFLSRDRVGIKPLYYLLDEENLVFASEIKGILAARPAERRPRRAYLARFLPQGLRDDGDETAFENIRALPAGHNAVYDVRRASLHVSRYWDIVPQRCRAERRRPDTAEALWELLESSIALQLRSDVPVGTCLSGGVDSSTIVGLMSRQLGKPVHTFSGLYDEAECNEQEFVEAVNRHTGSIACAVRPRPQGDLLEDLRRIAWHQDEPTAGPGLYTQYHVLRRARRDVTVILDGQGGDELFGGYLYDLAYHLRDLMRGRPIAGRMRALPLLLSIGRHWGLRTAAEGWNTFFGGALTGLKRRAQRRSVGAADVLHPALRGWRELDSEPRGISQPFDSELDNELYAQVFHTSLPTLLHYEDRNSMAWSLEARVPLLDHRIVEFAFALGGGEKIRGSWTKWPLRRAAERVVPAEVAWRRSKMGYPTPMAGWLRQPRDRDAAHELLFSRSLAERELVCPQALRRAWDQHQHGADHSRLLYRLLSLELWFRHTIDAWQPCPAVEPGVKDRAAA